MSLRIIAGQFKWRILKSPKGSGTRPTQGMLRGAVFNICQQSVEGAAFLDLFAGSGAMGLEALSRGARHATLVEMSREAISAIRENIGALDVASQATLLPLDAKAALKQLTTPFDLIYVDPPYAKDAGGLIKTLLERKLLVPGGTLFLEVRSSPNPTTPQFSPLIYIDSRRFGDALLHQYRL